jgi:glutaredoxin
MRYFISLTLAFIAFTTQTYSAVPAAPTLNVEIYTIPSCPGCEIAKSTFRNRGISFTEISLYGRRDLYRQMKERVNAALPAKDRAPMEDSMTVPKIFINGKYIPYADLDNQLDRMQALKPANANQADESINGDQEENSNRTSVG